MGKQIIPPPLIPIPNNLFAGTSVLVDSTANTMPQQGFTPTDMTICVQNSNPQQLITPAYINSYATLKTGAQNAGGMWIEIQNYLNNGPLQGRISIGYGTITHAILTAKTQPDHGYFYLDAGEFGGSRVVFLDPRSRRVDTLQINTVGYIKADPAEVAVLAGRDPAGQYCVFLCAWDGQNSTLQVHPATVIVGHPGGDNPSSGTRIPPQ